MSGDAPIEPFEDTMNSVAANYRTVAGAQWWEQWKNTFDPGYVGEIDSRLRDGSA